LRFSVRRHSENDKTQIVEWLQANEILFPASATLRQLRKLASDTGCQEMADIPENTLEEEDTKI